MSKHFSKKRRLKYVLLALTCAASFTATGLAACTPESEDNEEEKKVSAVDNQLLKNGNFEFYDVPKAEKDGKEPVYLINSPNNWTHGGSSSYTMSGIINTNKSAWDLLSADDLAGKLDANNALNKNDSNYKEDYVDYNGMKSSDLLYKDTYSALKTSSIKSSEEDGKTVYKLDDTVVYLNENNGEYYFDADFSKPLKAKLDNPGTHYNVQGSDSEGYYYMDGGKKVTVYKDENGDYFLKYDKETGEYSETFTNVLMLHNYSSSAHNGIEQSYASISIDLPANTAAEVSLWVKTSDLLFRKGTEVTQDRGAYIAVTQSVGGKSLDEFRITSIDTETLIKNDSSLNNYNGWVQYTVYINACDFASSTVSLKLGLGESDYTVEGYAFFDDVTVTKYADLSDEGCSYDASKIGDAKCTLSSSADEKIFNASKFTRNEGLGTDKVEDVRYSENFHYLLDLASERDISSGSGYVPFNFNNAKLKAGLTVDSDKYVSSSDESFNYNGLTLDNLGKVKLPDELKKLNDSKGFKTDKDLLALVKPNEKFNSGSLATDYADKLKGAIESASSLPKANENSDVIVLLSARGAAYTASFDLKIEKDQHKIVSFWVKTSDMGGNTAATLTLKDTNNKDISTNFTVDTTDVVTDLDDTQKDIYSGWVQCFFFVENNDNKDRDLTFEFSFGNTAISGTAVSAYRAGWVALANLQTLDVDDETYAFTSTNDYSSSLTLSKDETSYTKEFDSAYGSLAHEIETGIVDPANYYGVNGGSSSVKKNKEISLPYDDINQNKNAGLINQEHVSNYGDWYNELMESFDPSVKSMTDALAKWNKVFGETTYQPLIILNKLRTVGETEVTNYGFIGNNSTASANSYTVVSVKVMVSEGAVAYVYLVDTSAGKKVLSFNTPSHSFYYDEDGNVLYKELDEDASLADRKANVLYTLRSDGLYEDKDGKLFANTWNYTKLYKDETQDYYDVNGNKIESFEDLIEGETYYADNTHSENKLANHFLVTSEGVKVFEYKDGNYYYIVDSKTQTEVITPFDITKARYNEVSTEYTAVVDARHEKNGTLGYDENGNYIAGKWVTVSFVIHAGSEAKNYRLELWSGERDKAKTDNIKESSSVVFDYSYSTVSDDSLKDWYENEIIKAYRKLLAEKDLLKNLASSEENISYYEGIVKENNISIDGLDSKYDILKNYKAHYYTFSLYDSAAFRPFNENTASENTTGYDYNSADYSETLAYLEVTDYSEEDVTYTVFVDYSTVDQSIEFVTDTDDEEDEETKDNDTNVWLLASSILLVVAMIFAILAILIKDMLKKKRHSKVTSKNSYDHNKAVRTMKRLKIKPEDVEEVESSAEETAEEPAEVEPEETNEVPVEPEEEPSVEEESAEPETEPSTEEATEPEAIEENETPDNTDNTEGQE